MANPTTNYGWPMPTATDLVTDLPADFAAFGQPVDTSLKALNPETTLGDISYRSSTANTNTRLGIGSTGQVLSVVGGVPAWSSPASSGSMTLLSTTTLSGASVTISSIDQTYKNLYIEIANTTNTGGTYYPSFNPNGSTAIGDFILLVNQGGTFTTNMGNSAQYNMNYNQRNQTSSDNYYNFTIYDYASTSKKKLFNATGFQIYSTSSKETFFAGGLFNTTSAITSINIATNQSYNGGTVLIYGVK